jgi:sensor histidine kinase regulating citrate/malate metabolism
VSWSLRRRLTVTVVALVAAVLVALAVVLYLAVRNATRQQRDDSLEARARALATNAEHDDSGLRGGATTGAREHAVDLHRSLEGQWLRARAVSFTARR